MDSVFLSQVNWLAVAVAALAYFILGSLWFAAIFGKLWIQEVEKIGIRINKPTKGQMTQKMIQTLVGNFIIVVAVAYVVFVAGSVTWQNGLKLGLICGIGFAVAVMLVAYTWESRSYKLIAIDAGYPLVGIVMAAIILSVWR